MKHILVLLATILGVSFSAQAVTQSEVIANISKNVILQNYVDFAQDAKVLKSAIDSFVKKPTVANLDKAQKAWILVRGTYELSEGFLFGPMDALGVDPMIDTWPLNLKDLRLILSGKNTITTDFVRSLGSDLQGFHAIEFLLFGEGIVTNTKNISEFTPRQFQYLQAAGELLVEQVDLLLFAWTTNFDPEDASTPSYLEVISNPGSHNQQYSSENAVIQEFVNGVINIIAEAGDGKLPDAAGDDIENANARLEESPFSWNSINDFTSNVDSVYNIYTGSYKNHRGPGLKDLVATQDPQLAQQVEAQILVCRDLIQAIKGPNNISFGKAIKTEDGRVRIFTAIKGLVVLRKMFEDQVAPLLEQ